MITSAIFNIWIWRNNNEKKKKKNTIRIVVYDQTRPDQYRFNPSYDTLKPIHSQVKCKLNHLIIT